MHPYILHTQIVQWMRENTTASLDEANVYASGCVSRFGNPEINQQTPMQFKPDVARREQMLDLLRILASDQPHKVATVSDRHNRSNVDLMTLWFAYKPSNGIILAFVSTWDILPEAGVWTMFAKKLIRHGESRILNRLLSTSLINYIVMTRFITFTVHLREVMDFNSVVPLRRFGHPAPYWDNDVAYESNSLLVHDGNIMQDMLPLILDCVGWTKLEDQALSPAERRVKDYYVNSGGHISVTCRCDKGVIGFQMIGFLDYCFVRIWGPSVRTPPREVIEV
jgi:hypothetical protein